MSGTPNDERVSRCWAGHVLATAIWHAETMTGPSPPAAPGFSVLLAPLTGALAALASLAYLARVDPHRPGAFPLCPFRLLTGWNCPACGGLRMAHDVLHGQLAAAAMDNAFLLIGIPMLAAWILLGRRRGQVIAPTVTLVVIAAVTFGWTLLRNLPGFPLVPTTLTG